MECRVNFLENPKEFYEPGQKLKVIVRLIVTKPEKVSKISCVILGYAKCKWTEDKGNGTGSDATRGREDYIKESFDLLGNKLNSPVDLTVGQHDFNIRYILASNLPTSFKCRNGSIKYKIQVNLERPWKMNSSYEFPFTVIRPLNLNSEPRTLKDPLKQELSKNFTLDFTSEPLYMSASIPFQAYVPGQTINLKIQVNNQSKTHVKEIKVSLKKIVVLSSFKPKKRTKQLVIPEGKVFTDPVPVLTVQNFEKQIVVPSLPPNISNCDIIHVRYELRVKAMTSGLSRSPKLKIPITIGTIPLMNRGTSIPPSLSSLNLLPPSYEEALRDSVSLDSSDGENEFHPRYPVFDFEFDESKTSATSPPYD